MASFNAKDNGSCADCPGLHERGSFQLDGMEGTCDEVVAWVIGPDQEPVATNRNAATHPSTKLDMVGQLAEALLTSALAPTRCPCQHLYSTSAVAGLRLGLPTGCMYARPAAAATATGGVAWGVPMQLPGLAAAAAPAPVFSPQQPFYSTSAAAFAGVGLPASGMYVPPAVAGDVAWGLPLQWPGPVATAPVCWSQEPCCGVSVAGCLGAGLPAPNVWAAPAGPYGLWAAGIPTISASVDKSPDIVRKCSTACSGSAGASYGATVCASAGDLKAATKQGSTQPPAVEQTDVKQGSKGMTACPSAGVDVLALLAELEAEELQAAAATAAAAGANAISCRPAVAVRNDPSAEAAIAVGHSRWPQQHLHKSSAVAGPGESLPARAGCSHPAPAGPSAPPTWQAAGSRTSSTGTNRSSSISDLLHRRTESSEASSRSSSSSPSVASSTAAAYNPIGSPRHGSVQLSARGSTDVPAVDSFARGLSHTSSLGLTIHQLCAVMELIKDVRAAVEHGDVLTANNVLAGAMSGVHAALFAQAC